MKASGILFPILLFLLPGPGAKAQLPESTELFVLLKSRDSLLFDAAFDRCDPEAMASLLSSDFEFYHDKGGPTSGLEAFLAPLKEGCANRDPQQPQPSKRILIPESLQVFPLYDNGSLYGAIQEGMHRFEFLDKEQKYQDGDIARFTHLWVLEGNQWKLKRVLSYDHQPQEPSRRSSSNR